MQTVLDPMVSDPKQSAFSADAKEFLRKRLIGKHVKVTIDMLSNKSFSQKLLGVRRKCRLFWIRWFRLTDTAEIYLLLVAGPSSNEDSISVEHPCYSIICLCRSGSLSCRMAGEKALLRVFSCLLGLSKLSHLIAQHSDVLVVAFGQARFQQEFCNVASGM